MEFSIFAVEFSLFIGGRKNSCILHVHVFVTEGFLKELTLRLGKKLTCLLSGFRCLCILDMAEKCPIIYINMFFIVSEMMFYLTRSLDIPF